MSMVYSVLYCKNVERKNIFINFMSNVEFCMYDNISLFI